MHCDFLVAGVARQVVVHRFASAKDRWHYKRLFNRRRGYLQGRLPLDGRDRVDGEELQHRLLLVLGLRDLNTQGHVGAAGAFDVHTAVH